MIADPLRSTVNTRTNERDIRAAFVAIGPEPCNGASVETVYEHGQWWIMCCACGAQYSVHDAEPGDFSFEEVTHGDEDGHEGDL